MHRKADSLVYIALLEFWILRRIGKEIGWRGFALLHLLLRCISIRGCLVSRSEETSGLTERRNENVQTE